MTSLKRFMVLPLFLIMLMMSSCTVMMQTLTNEEKSYAKTAPDKIVITTEDQLPQNFAEVGVITTTQSSIEKAKQTIRKQAAEVGGDAIIDFKVTVVRQFIMIVIIPIPVDNYICRGRIVRFI
jgi:methionine-rich copper-binding protein CopC